MWNSDHEIKDVPTEKVNRAIMAFVESAGDFDVVDSQSGTADSRKIRWWPFALPVLAIMFIIAAHFLSAPVTVNAEEEESWSGEPVLLKASTSSKRPRRKSRDKTFVSGIAYNKNRAIAFIGDTMISEGGVVDGVTVSKIHENSVEFEKNGKRWTQEVGE